MDISKGNFFLKSFEQFGRLSLISRIFSVSQPALITKIKRVNKGELTPTSENYQILLYCYFIKIIKKTGTSFQSLALSQKHVRNVCYKIQYHLT